MKANLKCHKYLKGKKYVKTNAFIITNPQINISDGQIGGALKKRNNISYYHGKKSLNNTLKKVSVFANCNIAQIKTLTLSLDLQKQNSNNEVLSLMPGLKESTASLSYRLKKGIYCSPQVRHLSSFKFSYASNYFTSILTLGTNFLLLSKLLKNFETM